MLQCAQRLQNVTLLQQIIDSITKQNMLLDANMYDIIIDTYILTNQIDDAIKYAQQAEKDNKIEKTAQLLNTIIKSERLHMLTHSQRQDIMDERIIANEQNKLLKEHITSKEQIEQVYRQNITHSNVAFIHKKLLIDLRPIAYNLLICFLCMMCLLQFDL